MIVALLIAMESIPMALPKQLEAPMDAYVACVHSNFWIGTQRVKPKTIQPKSDSRILDHAIRACAQTRDNAVAGAEQSLSHVPGYEDPRERRAFVRDHFEKLDWLVRNGLRFDGKPDRRTLNASN